MNEDQKLLKYRLTGATVWLLLLIIIVPIWYANPINFNANNSTTSSLLTTETTPLKVTSTYITPTEIINKSTTSTTWLLRLASFKNEEKAQEFYTRLKYDYNASIKFHPDTQIFAVRVGPYIDKQTAIQDQKELNNLLNINPKLIEINK